VPGRRQTVRSGFTLIELGVSLLIVASWSLWPSHLTRVRGDNPARRSRPTWWPAFHVQGLVFLEREVCTSDEAILRASRALAAVLGVGAPGAVTVVTRDPATAGVCLFGQSVSGRWFAVHYSTFGVLHLRRDRPGAVHGRPRCRVVQPTVVSRPDPLTAQAGVGRLRPIAGRASSALPGGPCLAEALR